MMKVLANQFAVRQEQGFDVYTLSNEKIEVAVVPQLGAKIVSMKDRRTGREWMWHPPHGAILFHNGPGDDFFHSPLIGIDECLPTIEPCVWRGRKLPDHGEVWSAAWDVDEEAWQKGALKTSVRLEISPFDFERTIELDDNQICLSYQLSNRNSASEFFLWAMHPLLKLQHGDKLVLPSSTRSMLNGETWVDAIDSATPTGGCSKLVAGPVSDGRVGVRNDVTGERFDFEWKASENNGLGLWLTRGGWHGHHHFAIEPTNAGADALTSAVSREWCGTVAGNSAVTWQIRLRVGGD
jgi:galactose mutarotase-like enzyme